MAQNTLVCPNCKKTIEITQALLHEFAEEAEKKFKTEIDKVREETEIRLKKKFEEEGSLELQDLKKELTEQKEKNEEFRLQELKLREEKRKLEEKEKELELSVERRLDEERKKIEEKIGKTEEEKYRMREKEMGLQIENLKKSLEEANRKASGVSQQVQGEVLELEVEERLAKMFPSDIIEGIAKGVRGADILQTVKNNGRESGKILWETKRAKWTPSWLTKLRDDARKSGASISVLVSEELPKEIDTFGPMEGVLVAGYAYIIPLAAILRRQLVAIHHAKLTAEHKDEKLEHMYQYLQSDSFRHHIEAFVEGIVGNQQDLETEKRSMMRIWKKREMQIQHSIENISNMYGELQGIMGSSLPEIKHLTLESGEEE